MVVSILYGIIFTGLINTLLLYWQKRAREQYGRKIFCLIGQDCEAVVLSSWGSTLGVPNELLGAAYYVGAIFLLFLHVTAHSYFALGLLTFVAFTASLFSFYLLALQIFVLKKYCSWCLLAIALNFAILGLALNV